MFFEAAARKVGVGARPGTSRRQKRDAIDRAGRDAEPAARAAVGKRRMHEFCRADDGVHRTRCDAQRAADARGLVDARNDQWLRLAARRIERRSGDTQQRG